jgi:hypothetical protein
LLFVDVTEEVAKELGRRLYEEVSLEGTGVWQVQDWKLVEFRVTAISGFRRVDPELAFHELAASAKGRWDEVDAIEYVRQVRCEN